MKKRGFTLAEVLIVLGIIGVVAALTIPNFIKNYKDKELSTRLAKFQSTMEKTATEYSISTERGFKNDTGSAFDFIRDVQYIGEFIESSTLYKQKVGASPFLANTPADITPQSIGGTYYALKDNTKVRFVFLSADNSGFELNVPNEKVMGGSANLWAFFDPNISGLGNNAHNVFVFGLTNKGFVLPSTTDSCLTAIANNKYTVLPSHYANSGACMKTSW